MKFSFKEQINIIYLQKNTERSSIGFDHMKLDISFKKTRLIADFSCLLSQRNYCYHIPSAIKQFFLTKFSFAI